MASRPRMCRAGIYDHDRQPVGTVPLESCRSDMPSIRLVLGRHKKPEIDIAAARHSLTVAWASYRQSTIRHFRQGLDFGRVCYEWRTKYKAQASRKGKGFNHLLGTIGIPKTTAYRWIRRYEMKNGLRAERNEVGDAHQNNNGSRHSDKVTSFRFCLTPERRKEFENDVKTLGGPEIVTRIFLDFVARAASENRQRVASSRKQHALLQITTAPPDHGHINIAV